MKYFTVHNGICDLIEKEERSNIVFKKEINNAVLHSFINVVHILAFVRQNLLDRETYFLYFLIKETRTHLIHLNVRFRRYFLF